MAFYRFFTLILFALALPALPLLFFLSKKRRASLLQRLGANTGLLPKTGPCRRIWVHALSVGEVRSALPLVQGLNKRFPHAEIVFTATTKTGFETARELYGNPASPLVSQTGYFPLDLPFSVARVSRIIDPDLVCIVETDLWPGFLCAMEKRQVPVVLVNARLSERSFKGYARLGRARGLLFSGLSHILVQTPRDADRFRALGIPDSKITMAGNIKFDQPVISLTDHDLAGLKARFGLTGEGPVWICGSTHEGEEEMIFRAFGRVRKAHPGLTLILAPRDPARSKKLLALAESHGFSACRLSREKRAPDVILVDGMGILARAYALCDLAFVGGSLVPEGGHNPLEPAMFKKPVIFGPHMADFFQVAELLTSHKGAFQVDNTANLTDCVEKLLADPGRMARAGANGFEVFSTHTGAVDKSLDCLARKGRLEGHV